MNQKSVLVSLIARVKSLGFNYAMKTYGGVEV